MNGQARDRERVAIDHAFAIVHQSVHSSAHLRRAREHQNLGRFVLFSVSSSLTPFLRL